MRREFFWNFWAYYSCRMTNLATWHCLCVTSIPKNCQKISYIHKPDGNLNVRNMDSPPPPKKQSLDCLEGRCITFFLKDGGEIDFRYPDGKFFFWLNFSMVNFFLREIYCWKTFQLLQFSWETFSMDDIFGDMERVVRENCTSWKVAQQ